MIPATDGDQELPYSVAPAIGPAILAIGGGSYAVLYAVAGVCAVLGGPRHPAREKGPMSRGHEGLGSCEAGAADQAARAYHADGGRRTPTVASAAGEAGRSRLSLVSAPAGFGKTTLITQWLAATAELSSGGTPAVAWVSLDEHDNDPITFWTYVVTALRTATTGAVTADRTATTDRATGGVGAEALALFGSPDPPIDAALATLLNDLQAFPRETVLVLDDYHVIEAPAVHEAVAHLLDHLPAHVHLVLAASR